MPKSIIVIVGITKFYQRLLLIYIEVYLIPIETLSFLFFFFWYSFIPSKLQSRRYQQIYIKNKRGKVGHFDSWFVVKYRFVASGKKRATTFGVIEMEASFRVRLGTTWREYLNFPTNLWLPVSAANLNGIIFIGLTIIVYTGYTCRV